MRFGDIPVTQAAGSVLAHSLSLAGTRWQKGRVLSEQDVSVLVGAGFVTVEAAIAEAGDSNENDAARRIAKVLSGPGLSPAAPVHGRVNLIADADGLISVDPRQISMINLIDDAVTVATVSPFERVARGDIVATIKIIPFFVAENLLDQIERNIGPAVRLHAFARKRVALVHTRLPGLKDSVVTKTQAVTAARLAALGSVLTQEVACPHDREALALTLQALAPADLVLIVGASAMTDAADVIPAALVAAGGTIERIGMPVDPGNLLCLGKLGAVPVIGLPGCARSPKRNGFDWILERLVAGLTVTRRDVAEMGVGGLIADASARLDPREALPAGHAGQVGILLLAAGRSSRMGAANKLLAPFGSSTVAAASLANAAKAGLAGIVAVVGHQGDAVAASLDCEGVNIVHCADYADGLSASLRGGLAALPTDWSAVIIGLADMPLVAPDVYQALEAAWRRGPHDVCIPAFDGKRGNPVLWGRSHFDALRRLEGDVGAKAVLAALGDRLTVVAVDTPAIFQDIDTPADLAAINPAR